MAWNIHQANALRWQKGPGPHSEVYYLKCCDPQGLWSFWFRYTLLIPENAKEEPTASLWGIFHHQKFGPLAIKKTYSLSETDVFHRDRFIQVGPGSLGIEGCNGLLEENGHRIEWNLHFDDPSLLAALYPHNFLYRGPFPKTKYIAPLWSTRFTGTLSIDDQVLRLDAIPGHQGHTWGTQYASRWAWFHGNSFKEDSEFILEGLIAQIPLGKKLSPPMKLLHFFYNGKRYAANGLIQWFRNKANYTDHELQFDVHADGKRFEGWVRRSPDLTVCVEYTGAWGEKRYCHNTNLADAEVRVYEKKGGQWSLEKTLTAHHAVSFENAEQEPLPGIIRVL